MKISSFEISNPFFDKENKLVLLSFFCLGLLNNISYVCMLAGANAISSSAVGLVYLAAVGPSAVVKASAPYWFSHVSYSTRVIISGVLMSLAYATVGILTDNRPAQLLGVAAASLQGGLGESSCLALTARYGGRPALTAWSSGTGFAGIAGYMWVAVLHLWLGFSFTWTLLIAQSHVALWWYVFFYVLPNEGHFANLNTEQSKEEEGERVPLYTSVHQQQVDLQQPQRPSRKLSVRQRFHMVVGLWPWMAPLFLVYFAEYAMQSGTWAVIGFPIENRDSRHHFYVAANWMYQVGVFMSRSSGMLWQPSMTALWVMPVAQLGFLTFFLFNGVLHFWWNYSLLVVCLCVGLLGGAVYVGGFIAIHRDVQSEHREFSLAAASLADSLGVACADVLGVVIQGCLFKWNNLLGADFKC